MSEAEDDILSTVRYRVWSGFDSPDEVNDYIDDLIEDAGGGDVKLDEEAIRAEVVRMFEEKRSAEASWPETTDCDRLDEVFDALDERGILCLHDAGYTLSQGQEDAADVLGESEEDRYFGYVFYHGQDLERAIDGGGLMLAFDHVRGDVPEKLSVGEALKKELEAVGFRIEWDGTGDRRIFIPEFDWKRRRLAE